MTGLAIKQLDSRAADFYQRLDKLLAWDEASDQQVVQSVDEIIAMVREQGDQALVEYTRRFDGLAVDNFAELCLTEDDLQAALSRIGEREKEALYTAADRVREYHEHQKQESWQYQQADGTVLGQQVTPLQRVGVYVPGGTASYPSSVLMNVIPARVAGVEEIIMMVPTPGGKVNDLVLAAAAIAGVDRLFTIGGAQAIAALAYGTESVPGVNKIVGPGNIYVATAKKQVFGAVGIDMIAGPSEILIICDGKTDPEWVAMDLFSQAEHDVIAQAILVCPDEQYIARVRAEMNRLLEQMDRSKVIARSLQDRGALVLVRDLAEAAEVANYVAPEHLELSVENARDLLPNIRNAGAIFVGPHTSEALGDYCAGPNHVLPTSGTAKFSSPLGVYDFQKRSSLIMCPSEVASKLGETASVLARGEGLDAHARAAELRISAE